MYLYSDQCTRLLSKQRAKAQSCVLTRCTESTTSGSVTSLTATGLTQTTDATGITTGTTNHCGLRAHRQAQAQVCCNIKRSVDDIAVLTILALCCHERVCLSTGGAE
jgi:hypothetical protein